MSFATQRVVLAWLSAGVLSALGCGGSPTSPGASPAASSLPAAASGTLASSVSSRSGNLQVTKDCDKTYNFQAGDFCTITSSNVDAIEVGSKVFYASAANLATLTLDSDVVLNPAKPGNNLAFGRCHVDLATGFGACRFSGGTGKFTHFQASVDVTPLGGLTFAWNGTYSFSPRD